MTIFEIDAAYIGDTPVEKIYLGAEEIYEDSPTPVDYRSMPLTIKALESGTFRVNVFYNDVQVSRDGGDTWDYLSIGTPYIEVSEGDELQFIGMPRGFADPSVAQGLFSGNTLAFDVYGNIESLEYLGVDSQDTAVNLDYAFSRCFDSSSGLHSAENLILPATALTYGCYEYMFYGCSGLITAPALPATQLTDSCYYDMFANCTSLTTAPELPATALTENCYYSMFKGCTSLTTAPVLSATTLAPSCYREMFSGCTSLNYIKCLATNISANGCVFSWVNGVAASGTFVKNANMTGWPRGNNGIPSGWVVIDPGAPETGVWLVQRGIAYSGTPSGDSYVWDFSSSPLDSGEGFYIIQDSKVITSTFTRCGHRELDGQYCDSEGGFDDNSGQFIECYTDSGVSRYTTTMSTVSVSYTPGVNPTVSASTSGTCDCGEIGLCDDGEGGCIECAEVDCDNDWETLGYSSPEECRCAEYGDCEEELEEPEEGGEIEF